MVRDYELMYIVRPELDDEALQAANQSVEQLITAAGGTVTHSTSWGRRRLAYEVKHLRDGHYMLLQLRLEGAQVSGVERALTISETVFRHLLVIQETPIEVEEGAENGTADARQAAVAALPEDGADQDEDDHDDHNADEQNDEDDGARPPAASGAATTPSLGEET